MNALMDGPLQNHVGLLDPYVPFVLSTLGTGWDTRKANVAGLDMADAGVEGDTAGAFAVVGVVVGAVAVAGAVVAAVAGAEAVVAAEAVAGGAAVGADTAAAGDCYAINPALAEEDQPSDYLDNQVAEHQW